MATISSLCLLAMFIQTSTCLDNGLATVPPMGWISWLTFGCNRNCSAYPDTCLSEQNVRAVADRLAADGYREAGYRYVVVDDCWLFPQRGPDGRQVPDTARFPSGIKALADYVHGKGLKFGIYTDIGLRTCAGFPGSQFFLELDAGTYASWGVDYVKVDGCNADATTMDEAFKDLGFFLNRTGRPMLYSCEWPAYQLASVMKPNYSAVRATCNSWRTFLDMQPSWAGVLRILAFWAVDPFGISAFAGPGAWNDPDVLVVGKNVLSADQEMLQMTMWAMMAAPMMLSADMRRVSSASRQAMLHPGVLSISQDPLGVQGTMSKAVGMLQYWRRPLHPAPSTVALAVANLDPVAGVQLRVCLSDFGLPNDRPALMFDVLANRTACAQCTCTQLALRPTSAALLRVRRG